jgi:hypothetical protein
MLPSQIGQPTREIRRDSNFDGTVGIAANKIQS